MMRLYPAYQANRFVGLRHATSPRNSAAGETDLISDKGSKPLLPDFTSFSFVGQHVDEMKSIALYYYSFSYNVK